jgi:serine/threonine-protein kinase
MVEIITREPHADLRELRPKIDKELVHLVNRCLERDPAARFQSVFEIAARLDEWLGVHGYQEGNEEALGRFVRRNAMRQMRWFERAIAGEMSPKKVGREPPRVPTYTEHTDLPREGSATEERAPAAAASPGARPAVTGRPLVPPRPGAPADPRSIRAANAVQQLKRLAPPVEPPRGRVRQRAPALDEDDATDVELHIPKALPRLVEPGEDDDEAGEEVPTLVQKGDAKLQAFRAEARRKQEEREGGRAAVRLDPRHPPPGRIADEEGDQPITEVKKKELPATKPPPPQPQPDVDIEPDKPTQPRNPARPHPA